MDRLQNLIRTVIRQSHRGFFRKKPKFDVDIQSATGGVIVKFLNGRKQHVHVSQNTDLYRLTSVILKRSEVEEIGRERLLPLIWQRNRETRLVAFSLDQRGALIGVIEQPSETSDVTEMRFYLERLAYECDQLEYQLRGVDDK